jgi:hypothetical protein
MRRLLPGAAWGAVIAAACLAVAALLAFQQRPVIITRGTYTVGAHTIPDPGQWKMPVGVQVVPARLSPVRARPLPVTVPTPVPAR